MSYNGHKSWPAWNVSLWLNSDEGYYKLMEECIRRTRNRESAVRLMMQYLPEKTPDGANYNATNVREAMRGL